MQCSDYIAKRLQEYGVERVFLVSGGGAMYLNRSLGKVLPYTAHHHEQACAIAAEGYARVSSKLGVVNVTTGPGGLNCCNGLFGQWTDSVPVLYLSGQVKRATMHTLHTAEKHICTPLRQLGDQEVDIISIVRPLTKYAVCVTDPNTIRYHLEKAIYEACSGRYGPVWLDIPIDVQSSMIDEHSLEGFTPPSIQQNYTLHIENVLARLEQAKRPLIIAGHGVRLSNSIDTLVRILEITGIPVVTTLNGFDMLADDIPSYIGRIGTIGQRAGNFALQTADCVLCLGTRNNIRQVSYAWENFAKRAYIIAVDIDEAELHKPLVHLDMPIHADCALFIPALLHAIMEHASLSNTRRWDTWLQFCHSLKERFSFEYEKAYQQEGNAINVYYFMHELIGALHENDICILANASPTICAFQTGRIQQGQRIFSNSGSASMGWALPAAIGAYYGKHSHRRVICVEGDGSIMMNLQELQTIYHNALPITIFVINNGGYSSIKQTQMNFFQGHLTGADSTSGVSTPDFIDIGKAFRLPTLRITSPEEIASALEYALHIDGPLLCEVIIDTEYSFTPKLASRTMEDGTIISPSLEDMYPFIERSIIEEILAYE